MQEVPIPRSVRKAELWQELQRLIHKKCPGAGWPDTVKAQGITKAELTSYIYALKPSHRYFGRSSQEAADKYSEDSASSFDSAFEEQFAVMVKALPTKLSDKIMKRQRPSVPED